jgi:TonB family protein
MPWVQFVGQFGLDYNSAILRSPNGFRERGAAMQRRTILVFILILTLSFLVTMAGARAQAPAPAGQNLSVMILSDTHGFDFGQYIIGLINRLRTTWSAQIPESAKHGEKGRSLVDFIVDRDGKIHDVRVVSVTVAPELNRAAQSAVEKADPFAKLPEGFVGDQLNLRVEFSYNLNPQ